MRTRLLVVCVAVAAALAGAAGCSSAPDGRTHAARPSSTPSSASPVPATANPDSARLTSLMRRLAAWSDDNHSVTATEIADFDGRKVRYDGLFTWGAQPAMDVRAPTAQLGLQQLNSADKTEILLVGDSYYYRVDPRPSGPLKGRHWLRAPLPQSADGSSAAAHGLQASPENGLRMLADATGWTDLGTQNVDGTVARHYMGTVTRAALSADSRLVRAVGGSPSALLAGADSAELDVWTDARGKPLRLVATLGAGRSIAVDLFDFGGPRTVAPPAARDTADAAAVSGRPAAL
jgi:hypothetical protein